MMSDEGCRWLQAGGVAEGGDAAVLGPAVGAAAGRLPPQPPRRVSAAPGPPRPPPRVPGRVWCVVDSACSTWVGSACCSAVVLLAQLEKGVWHVNNLTKSQQQSRGCRSYPDCVGHAHVHPECIPHTCSWPDRLLSPVGPTHHDEVWHAGRMFVEVLKRFRHDCVLSIFESPTLEARRFDFWLKEHLRLSSPTSLCPCHLQLSLKPYCSLIP